MLDLNTRVDLNEVVPAHLVDQELCGTSVAIADALRELDRVAEDRLAVAVRLQEADEVSENLKVVLHHFISGS